MIKLKEIREEKGLFQKEIATILNTTQQQYSLYEKQERTMPIEKYIILAKYYNTSIDYLTGLTNQTEPYPKNKT